MAGFESSSAFRGQHMVGPGPVVGEHFSAGVAHEERSICREAFGDRVRGLDMESQMLGGDPVAEFDGFVQILDHDYISAVQS